ncbi:hypothetical protein GJ496_007408 [Pomphorhynchus laevis]|nr:hypothetical protein GJ496_007408 [Pomphorhynchus laevis]
MSFICSQCGSSNIDNDPARGNPACIDCGTVVATELIISEVEFEEVAGGRHKAVGQFVGKGEIGATSLGGLHHGNKRSREITLYNAKRHISAMANALSMPSHLVDMAHNFYKLSLDQGLTRGRKLTHIVASCLYIVARLEGTPHMLLDFCDLAQANVVVVCKCYMCITMALCIHLPPTDPSLYIPRFAEKLGFGEKSHQVAMTALRIAQRMKRDWMVLGRRPAGLCGAALLFAARIHGFNRTIENIAATVKLIEEFTEKDEDLLLPECDPPAYKRSQCIDSLLEQELKNLNPDNFERDICLLEKQIEHEIQKLCQKSTSKTNFKALSRFTQGSLHRYRALPIEFS